MSFPIIREERKKRGWTQQELADKSYVSLSTVRRLETDPDYKPSSIMLYSVSNALGLDYEKVILPIIAGVAVDRDPENIKQVDLDGMIACYNALNDKGKALIKELAYDLSQLDKYRNKEAEE